MVKLFETTAVVIVEGIVESYLPEFLEEFLKESIQHLWKKLISNLFQGHP